MGDALPPRRGGVAQLVVGVDDEAGPVEDQFVLAAHLVDVDQRQAGLANAVDGVVEAQVVLVQLEGRAVGDDQDLGSRLGQGLGDV